VPERSPGRALVVVAASARALVELADRAGLRDGCRLLAADAFADRDTLARTEAAAAFPSGRFAEADEIVATVATVLGEGPRAAQTRIVVGGGLEPAWPELLPRLAAYGEVAGPTPSHAALLASPRKLRASLDGAPVAFPEAAFERVPNEGRWLVKPALRAGGGAVRPAKPGTVLVAGTYAEAELDGAFLSVCGVRLAGATRVLGAARHVRLPGGRPRGEAALVAHPEPDACGLPASVATAIATAVAERLDFEGIFGLDLVLTCEAGPKVLDVNLRPPASLELFPEAVAAVAEWLGGAAASVAVQPRGWRGRAVVYAPFAFTLTAVAAASLERLSRTDAPAHAPSLHDLPHAGTRFAAHAPVCTVSGFARDAATLTALLATRVRRVEALFPGPSS